VLKLVSIPEIKKSGKFAIYNIRDIRAQIRDYSRDLKIENLKLKIKLIILWQ